MFFEKDCLGVDGHGCVGVQMKACEGGMLGGGGIGGGDGGKG